MKRIQRKFQFGPGGKVYILITALTLGGAVFTQANLLFWSFGLMFGGIICSFGLTVALMRRIEIKRLVPSHGVVDEAMAIRYRIRNRKRWLPSFNLVICEAWSKSKDPPQVQPPVHDDEVTELSSKARPATLNGSPHAWVMHLGPRQTQRAEAPCWPHSRGVLTLESIVVSSSFPFGLFRWSMQIRQHDQLIIYPALFRMKRTFTGTLALAEPTGSLRHQRSGGSEEFYGLRPYRAGDSQRMIDWKHTARTGQLISRQMTQASPPRIMLLVDLNMPTAQADDKIAPTPKGKESAQPLPKNGQESLEIERAISLAASLICDAYKNGHPIGMVVAGAACDKFPIHHSLPHRSRMLNALALLDPSTQAASSDSLPAEPNVTIHACPAPDRQIDHPARPHLYASQIDQYLVEIEGDSSSLLSLHLQTASGGNVHSPGPPLVAS